MPLNNETKPNQTSPLDLGSRIHWLHLCNECPDNDTKPSDGETQVLEFGGMRRTLHNLCSLVYSEPGVVAPDMVLSMGQIELFDF